MNRIKNVFIFLTSNFGPLLGFYSVNYFWGFEAGIYASIVIVLFEFFWLRHLKQEISNFFYFSSAVILIFGVTDLFITEPFFMKYEAALTNLLFAVFFGLSLLKEKPIVQEFAESQKKTSSEPSPDKSFFFRVFTVFWCSYFLMKAAFYVWIGFTSTLSDALVIRFFVGKISFWLMMFISVGIPRKIWQLMERFKLFPSQRGGTQPQFVDKISALGK